jgi:hypothetical protein
LRVVIYYIGQKKEIHFNELFSKMTLTLYQGLPRIPWDGILLDKSKAHSLEVFSKMTLTTDSGHPKTFDWGTWDFLL